MSIIESLIVFLFFGILVIFVISCIFIFLKIFTSIITKIVDKQNKQSNKNTETPLLNNLIENTDKNTNENNFSTGELKLYNVDEKTAAMIIAIVSHECQIPLSELIFKSIKAVKEV